MDVQQMELCLVLWTLMNQLIPTKGGSFQLHTTKVSQGDNIYTKLSEYGYEVGTSTCIVLKFMGCSDAFIGLMQEDDESRFLYEVLFGGWGDTKSVIQQTKPVSKNQTMIVLSDVVACNEFRKLKVGWREGKITAYRWKTPCEWEVLMSLNNTGYSVKFIGVSTGTRSNGDWNIANEECHEPINQNTLWKNDITRKDTVFSSAMFVKPDIDSSHQCAMQCQRYSDCCYYTYNGNQRNCRGFSDTGPSNTSVGTQLWIRY